MKKTATMIACVVATPRLTQTFAAPRSEKPMSMAMQVRPARIRNVSVLPPIEVGAAWSSSNTIGF
jgi:hypothetical protein